MKDLVEIPKELLRLKNPPKKLYFKGKLELLNLPKIAIVGSRRASVYSKNCVNLLAKTLSKNEICVVSGGAIGIDIFAHKGSFPFTICVMPCGLDIFYPPSNSRILSEIYQNALAISEYESKISAFRHSFLERNRLVVALSEALVVAQADLISGSMQSAKIANELKIPIYVLPQRLGESEGTNKLLKDNKASLITDFDDFASKFNNKKITHKINDEILEFCKFGVDLSTALDRFGNKIYEYELDGKIKIENLRVQIL